MSSQNRIQHVPAGSGPGYWGPGDQIRFILTGAQTGGPPFTPELIARLIAASARYGQTVLASA